MGYFGSAFSSSGNGLYVGTANGGYTGTGSTSSYSNSRVTSRVGSYIKTEYATTISRAKEYLADGDLDKATAQIEKIREYAQEYADDMGYDLDDDKLNTALARAGADFSDYTDENYDGSFMTGIKNGIPLLGLLNSSYSDAEVDAKLNNEDLKTSDVVAEATGKAISGSAVGAVVGGVIGTFVAPGLGTATGAKIGAVVGTGIAYLQNHLKEWAMAS